MQTDKATERDRSIEKESAGDRKIKRHRERENGPEVSTQRREKEERKIDRGGERERGGGRERNHA